MTRAGAREDGYRQPIWSAGLQLFVLPWITPWGRRRFDGGRVRLGAGLRAEGGIAGERHAAKGFGITIDAVAQLSQQSYRLSCIL